MSQETAIAWAYTDKFGWQDAAVAGVGVCSPAFLYGETLFESFRAHQGRWLALDEHFGRFEAGITAWDWDCTFDRGQMRIQLNEGLEKLGRTEAYARLSCWPSRGSGGPGILPASESGWLLLVAPLNGGAFLEGPAVRLGIAEKIGRDAWALPYALKHGNYLPSIWAAREARERKLDDLILCRQDGSPVEASASNLLVWDEQDGWLTPTLGRDGLAGIARNALLRRGVVRERAIGRKELYRTSAMALVNSVRGLRFAEAFDDRVLLVEGPSVDVLRNAWQGLIADWLASEEA